MSVPFVNFINAPGIDYNKRLAEDFSGILKGYEKGYALAEQPGEYKRKKEKEELSNVIKGAEAKHAPKYYEERAKMGGLNNLHQALLNQQLQTYGGREKEANIAHTEAQTGALLEPKSGGNEEINDAYDKWREAREKYGDNSKEAKLWENRIDTLTTFGGKSAISQGLRNFNSMPAAAKENTLAQTRSWKVPDTEAISLFGQGYTLNDIKEMQKEKGVDVDKAQPIYAPTSSVITNIKNAEGFEAEIKSLTESTAKDLSAYGGPTINGVYPKEALDSVFGTNKQNRLNFLGARAIQAEIAGARSRFAGASNAMEAIHGMQKDALARVEVFQPGISGKDREYVQHYINDKLGKAFEARKAATLGTEQEMKEALNHKQADQYGYTNEDYEYTAKKHGVSVDEIKSRVSGGR